MGRTVSVPGNAVATVYIDVSEYDSESWPGFIDDLRAVIRERYPSFQDCDKWVGRESHAILENNGVIVVLSEYCGLASVSIGSCEGGVGQLWCRQIASHWRARLEKRYPDTALRHLATASNGEGFYQRV